MYEVGVLMSELRLLPLSAARRTPVDDDDEHGMENAMMRMIMMKRRR